MNIIIFFHTGLLYTPEVFSLFKKVWGLGSSRGGGGGGGGGGGRGLGAGISRLTVPSLLS